MRSYFLLNLSLLVGVAACDFKGNDSASDTSDDSTGGASSSDSEGTTTGVSDGSGQSSNSGGSSVGTTTTDATTGVGTVTATSTTTTDATTGMTTSTTSATSASTSATTDGPPPDPIDPTPCEGEAKVIPGQAIAYLESQVPPPPPDMTGGSGTSGGDPVDPGTLHVRLSSQSLACEDPGAALKCGGNWAVSFALAPEFQAPGLYHLSGPSVFGVGTETGPDEGGGECSWGGGSFFATLEIIAVDDEAVTGRLCHIDAAIPANAAELEGKFVAPRCP